MESWLTVALLAEGVDRNCHQTGLHSYQLRVALLAEGVDRNFSFCTTVLMAAGRPPRGGRG